MEDKPAMSPLSTYLAQRYVPAPDHNGCSLHSSTSHTLLKGMILAPNYKGTTPALPLPRARNKTINVESHWSSSSKVLELLHSCFLQSEHPHSLFRSDFLYLSRPLESHSTHSWSSPHFPLSRQKKPYFRRWMSLVPSESYVLCLHSSVQVKLVTVCSS